MRKQTKLVAVLSAAALLAIGASMTSYAAGGWVAEGDNDWVYLDSDGERVTNEWKRSGDNYYYLDEDGLMAKNTLIHDDDADAIYYVNENGTKVMGDWVCIENTEDEQPGDMDETPSVLYYHFGASGKADRASGSSSDGTVKKVKNIDGKYYVFDEEGRMLSGWQEVWIDGEQEYFYLGTENEGFAYTGWQKLEPDEKLTNKDYDDLKWFYFGSNGRAYKGETKYINGKYYTFNEYGVMADDWFEITEASPDSVTGGQAYAANNGTSGKGWVLAEAPESDDNDDEKYWYYLVTIRDGSNVARAVPYNYYGDGKFHLDGTPVTTENPLKTIDGKLEDSTAVNTVGTKVGDPGYRAKIIKNKTYIFDSYGRMLTGFVVIDNASFKDEATAEEKEAQKEVRTTSDNDIAYFRQKNNPYAGIEGRDMEDGLYYFSEKGGSEEGQMQTGRTAISQDGDTHYYYFNKKDSKASNYGKALVNTIKDGYLYGPDGKCVEADDGNSYEVYKLTYNVTMADKVNAPKLEAGDDVIVSRTGKIKQNGNITIDGVKYTISNYKIIKSEDTD